MNELQNEFVITVQTSSVSNETPFFFQKRMTHWYLIQQPEKSNSTFYVGGLVTNGTAPSQILTEDSLDLSPRLDSEPQSLMGVRFACHTLENAMPLIIQEVLFKRTSKCFGACGRLRQLDMLMTKLYTFENFPLLNCFVSSFIWVLCNWY